MRSLASQSTLPWLCLGDFNEILRWSEKKGGNDRAEWQMNNFREAVDVCGLQEVDFNGYKFTYDNGREQGTYIQCRLDRAFGSDAWFDLFSDSQLVHLEREWSDHAPIKLFLWPRNREMVLGDRPFRFEQFWGKEDECENVVVNAWLGGASMVSKLEMCAADLRKWRNEKFGPAFKKLKSRRKELKKLNGGGLTPQQMDRRKRILREITELLELEESYWKQRSRVLWLAEGDKNSKFFHQRVSGRKKKNSIRAIKDENGVEVVGDNRVGQVVVNYFRSLFTSSTPSMINEALRHFQGRVTREMNEGLQMEYQVEEIRLALSQMHPIKAPGPDGMCPMSFQSYWHIVGPSISYMVLRILRGGSIPSHLNRTFITLIPKKNKSECMMDFRAISLCNVVYKLISKVLANRLKKFLDKIVYVNQSAFTPGRLITDNILVAFEFFYHMKHLRSAKGGLAVKLDMSKAYDRVEWDFLDAVLVRFGFDTGWCGRVMECVRSVTFAMLVNGWPTEDFTPNRGIRQGDPLSPYLFILCAEIFSHLLRRAEENNSLRGLKVASLAPSVNHLLFADDCIIFSRASLQDAEAIKQALHVYELSSGQKVNFDKTTISFSRGVTGVRRQAISSFLGVREVDIHDRYLGLPTVVGYSKKKGDY